MVGRPHEEAVFERSLRDPSCMAGRHGEFWAPVVVGRLGKHGLGGESGWGCCVCLGDSALSRPHLTLFPFLPGSRAPSLAALRDMPVSTSTPPQTSLSARKSSGT